MQNDVAAGRLMYQWATDLYPICRSITGDGVRQTLAYIKNILPQLKIHEIPSGTKVFDWTIPEEWNIADAFVANEDGVRIIDFKKHNLHVVNYSEPIDQWMSFKELDKHLYSLPEQPHAIPYISSYYKRRWGFCLSENQRNELRKKPDAKYHVKIDSSLRPGFLTYGELVIAGEVKEEILLSTYVCHPSMANNELSGPVVATGLAEWIKNDLKKTRYTYRILFLVETIGAIAYLSQHLAHMKKNVIAGFVLTCVGDNRGYSYLASRTGDTLADRVAQHVLKNKVPDYHAYSYLERGSDERQYGSPGIDLPMCSIHRTLYGKFPEYHTSLDDLSLISPEGLLGAFVVYQACIKILENNLIFKNKILCEPQLGKRGLYPTLSTKDTLKQIYDLSNFLAYADGTNDLLAIAEKIKVYAIDLLPIIEKLQAADLIEINTI